MIANKEMSAKILEILEVLVIGGQQLLILLEQNLFEEFEELSLRMDKSIKSIENSIAYIKDKENLPIKTDIQSMSVRDSLNRIMKYFKTRSPRCIEKIEFELIPLLEEMHVQFYFWACVYGDKKKENYYYQNEMVQMNSNKYVSQSERVGKYKYDLSIAVLGYNKLDYTSMCIESLLKYLPQSISYELIFVNHGSTDGTKKYFEEISPTKQIDILENGGGLSALYRIIEGKYFMTVSNDVLVTESAIENMLKCIESDENIGWVVPSTPNVSNLQTINADYKDIREMYAFASDNNKSDRYRWEQRTRLCNPIDIKSSKILLSNKGVGSDGYFHSLTDMSFPDDRLSLRLRRNGYKMMLAKDAYCYHFGSVTLKDEIAQKNTQNFYDEGRKEFKKVFGIDPWGTGFCWDPSLIQYLPCDEGCHVDVLGINCGIGSNPLKVKESIKENVHNLDVTVYNVTDEECYIEDLKGVSDIAEYRDTCDDISNIFKDRKFKYIIVESKFEAYKEPLKMLLDLKKRLVEGGIIAIKTSDINLQNKIKTKNSNVIQSDEWIILRE